MNKRRLLKLANLLEADAKNKTGIQFDMSTWGVVHDKEKPMSCGTMACAMGLAALSGKFKRAGLGYSTRGSILHVTMDGRGDGVRSACRLFEISLEEAEQLFIWPAGVGSQGERAAAKRIRKFVAGKYPTPLKTAI